MRKFKALYVGSIIHSLTLHSHTGGDNVASAKSTFKTFPSLIRVFFFSVSCPVAPDMLPGFPPGIFPFWGPFPAVPPPAAAAASGAPDAPRSSTEATRAAGKDKI